MTYFGVHHEPSLFLTVRHQTGESKKRLKPKHSVTCHCCHIGGGGELDELNSLQCLCNQYSVLKRKVTSTNSNKNKHTSHKQQMLGIKPKVGLFPVCLSIHNELNIP